jgi:hypothetical protein
MFFFTILLFLSSFCSAELIDASKYALTDQTVIDTHGLNTTSNGWTLYKQCDSQWANNQLGTCSETICSAGCAMSSVAMILQTKGAGQNPGTLNTWLKSHSGYSGGCNINWASVNAFGVVTFIAKEPGATESEICDGLSKGHGLVANVHNGGHWVLLTGCRGGGVFDVNDPGYSTTTYKKSDIVDLAVYH